MNARVLELLKNPKNIQSEDLNLLKEEINSFPYIQNIRALHLYGVHLFDKENYQKELSTTAAYTTDKKILYQLINGKIQQKKIETLEKESEVIVDKIEENKAQTSKEPFWWVKEKKTFPKHDYKAVSESLTSPKTEIKHVIVNGERNRILFEGEENYLEEKNADTIDLESTLESGVIVTQKSSFPIKPVIEAEDIAKGRLSVEASNEIIHEGIIDSENSVEVEIKVPEAEPVEPETEVLKEKPVENENLTENIDSEVAKSEAIITEDTFDSEKIAEKVSDESEVSFLEVESFDTEKEIHAEESIVNENSAESAENEETTKVLNPEVIINEDEINSQDVAEKINDESELSFHGTDAFLPEVKIEASVSEQINPTEVTNSTVNKHEDEMRRLIEEVEKKMKAAHKKEAETKAKEPEAENKGEISFAEIQDFVVSNENEAKAVEKAEVIQAETSEEKNDAPVLEEVKEENSGWKPMNFESHTPDSFSKKIEIEPVVQDEKPEEVKEVLEEIILEEEKSETVVENISEETVNKDENSEPEIADSTGKEARVMNVSFFGTDISSLSIKKEEEQQQDSPKERVEELPLKEENQTLLDSNVPGFINTWQSWLKIDRTEEIEKVKTETKNKVIESFIENNPKISQLKDVVNFVVKEKTDDISHLMTETLANLYIEQKLYTKAINAFKTLIKKHPGRKEYFENKIQEVKDNRGKN